MYAYACRILTKKIEHTLPKLSAEQKKKKIREIENQFNHNALL